MKQLNVILHVLENAHKQVIMKITYISSFSKTIEWSKIMYIYPVFIC